MIYKDSVMIDMGYLVILDIDVVKMHEHITAMSNLRPLTTFDLKGEEEIIRQNYQQIKQEVKSTLDRIEICAIHNVFRIRTFKGKDKKFLINFNRNLKEIKKLLFEIWRCANSVFYNIDKQQLVQIARKAGLTYYSIKMIQFRILQLETSLTDKCYEVSRREQKLALHSKKKR